MLSTLLEDDYNTFSKRGQVGDRDLWGQHLQNLIHHRLGDYALSLVDWKFHKIEGHDLARINIEPSAYPVYDKGGKIKTFWHRTPTSTLAITDERNEQESSPPAGAKATESPSGWATFVETIRLFRCPG